MRVEPVAVYGYSNYAGTVPRTGSVSRTALTRVSAIGEKTPATQTESTQVFTSGDGDAAKTEEGAEVFSNADGDTVEISAEGQKASRGQLDAKQQQVVAQLKAIDQQVRSHEMAHLTAAGPYARGAPSYSYVKGPNGVSYAVGGEVPIDISPEPGDPEATIRKAEVVRAAALAPADPSGQDRQVAAAATKLEAQARQELTVEKADSQTDPSADQADDTDTGPDAQAAADGEKCKDSCQSPAETGSKSGLPTGPGTALTDQPSVAHGDS